MITRPVLLVALVAACNDAPEGLSVSIEPTDPDQTSDLRVVVVSEATDPNKNDVVSLRFAWSLDGVVQADLLTDTVPADRTAKNQVWSVVVTPADDKIDGASASDEVTIRNLPPEVAITLAPTSPKTDEDLVLSVQTTDGDDDVVTPEPVNVLRHDELI
jgi:hypothetical protein